MLFVLLERQVKDMTKKQKIFADEYLIDCNGMRAYKVAYPSVKNDNVAKAAASRLLTDVNVKAYIDEKLAEMSSDRIADAKEVLEYLTSVLRGKSQAEIVVVEGCGDGISSARRISKAPDEKEKLKAAELLGKRYGIYTDKVNVDGAIPVIISGEDLLEE